MQSAVLSGQVQGGRGYPENAVYDRRGSDFAPNMRSEMEQAAEVLEFERAADLRDRIRAAERVVTQRQIVHSVSSAEAIANRSG